MLSPFKKIQIRRAEVSDVPALQALQSQVEEEQFIETNALYPDCDYSSLMYV
jgi:N-acetylglutamate synthase-like GNAT family acetyltransferase